MPDATIYLAGPDIFFPDAVEIGVAKKALCVAYGFEGLYPLDVPVSEQADPEATALAIYRADLALMARADAVVANLTPFRGPSADPGTVFELAWMLARHRPVFAYSNDPATLRARVAGARQDTASHRWTTPDGVLVEDFGLPENLMIACALLEAGAPMVTDAGRAPLWAFEQCLVAARASLDGSPDRWRAADGRGGGATSRRTPSR